MANSLEKPKMLDVVHYIKWKQKMYHKSKANLTHAWMIGDEGKCMLTKAVQVAEANTMEEVKAEAAKAKAIQEMANYMWDSLHPLDQSYISKERDDDDLPGMWAKIKLQN